jgi:hypothetical protein
MANWGAPLEFPQSKYGKFSSAVKFLPAFLQRIWYKSA